MILNPAIYNGVGTGGGGGRASLKKNESLGQSFILMIEDKVLTTNLRTKEIIETASLLNRSFRRLKNRFDARSRCQQRP